MRLALKLLALTTLIVLGGRVIAEPHPGHAEHHAHYQSWVNGNKKGCCNDRDCRPLREEHEREVKGELTVFVEGVGVAKDKSEWCRVLPHHYLSQGNAPNWSTSHICVTDHYGGKTPCEQFICFQT
jgi:hypothetical protein